MLPIYCADHPRLPHKDARTSQTRLYKSIILPLLIATLRHPVAPAMTHGS